MYSQESMENRSKLHLQSVSDRVQVAVSSIFERMFSKLEINLPF